MPPLPETSDRYATAIIAPTLREAGMPDTDAWPFMTDNATGIASLVLRPG